MSNKKSLREQNIEIATEFRNMVKESIGGVISIGAVNNPFKVRNEPIEEASNPEGDKLVNNFIKSVAKKHGYSEQEAVNFITTTIKKLGYK